MRPTARPAAVAPDRSFRVTREGRWWAAVGLGLAGIGWVKTIPPLLLLGYAALALFALNAWLARRQLRGVGAVRVPHPPVYAGEPTRVALRLRNDGPRPVTAGVCEPAGGTAVTGLFEALVPGAEAERAEPRTFFRRGAFGHEPPRAWSDAPFGLVRAEVPGAAGPVLLVLPAVGGVDLDGFRRWARRQAGAGGRSRQRVARSAADRADLRGVRPYRPGDGLRDIHWRTTARRGEPFVRDYDSAPDPELVLVVEPWLPGEPAAAQVVRLEEALSLAASVVRAWCLAGGTRVTVAVAGDEPVVRTATPSEAAARDLLAPLATAAGTNRPALPDLAGRLRRSTLVVVSSRPGSPLGVAVGRAAGRAVPVVAPADRPVWYHPPHPAAR
ncbi:DUF58 domain-containing protein [bacterium]|nr:DUF58 domain-containing protein [bacterium]